jgi:hypothetical protein
MQYGAMFKKKLHFFKRDMKGIGCELIYPFFILLLPIWWFKLKGRTLPSGLDFDHTMYPTPSDILVNNDIFNSFYGEYIKP